MKLVRRRAPVVLGLLLAAGSGATMHACKEPTQVTVDIRTLGFKCRELRRISIVVSRDPDGAEKSWESPQAVVDAQTSCASDDEVGTLVITPSGTTGAVMVLASYTDAKCVPPDYFGCIVARRRFSFIDNVRLHLPITLEASCKDVPCNALSSCRSGVCVSSETDCASDGSCATSAEPVVAPDGGTIPPPADATLDIPPNDAFVPPDEDVIPPPPPPDAGPDADADAPFVVPGDGAPGNSCPSSPAGLDCLESNGQVCCASQNFACSPSTACDSGPWFACTGRKHCGGGWCCAAPTVMSQGQTSACSSDPNCTGGVVLCNTNADCPAPLVCTVGPTGGPYTGRGNGLILKCNPVFVPPDQ